MRQIRSPFEIGLPDDVLRMDLLLDDDENNLGDGNRYYNLGIGLRANTAGVVMIHSLGAGDTPRTIALGAGESVGILFTRVLETGTTATGIDAFTVQVKNG